MKNKFSVTALAYGRKMCIIISPKMGKIFGLTNGRQVLVLNINVSKNKIVIKKEKYVN